MNMNPEISAALGSRLRSLRSSKGLTQKDVAVSMGTTYTAISRFESGTTCPNIHNVCRYLLAINAQWVDVAKTLDSVMDRQIDG